MRTRVTMFNKWSVLLTDTMESSGSGSEVEHLSLLGVIDTEPRGAAMGLHVGAVVLPVVANHSPQLLVAGSDALVHLRCAHTRSMSACWTYQDALYIPLSVS